MARQRDGSLMLRGINLSGLEFSQGPQPPLATMVPYYVGTKRMNVVRIPFEWGRIQPKLLGPLDPVECAKIHALANQAIAAGASVILDLHNYGRYNGQTVGSSAVPVRAFRDVWFRIAKEFPGASFIPGLMNEPHDMDDGWLIAMAEAGIEACRSGGYVHNLILVGFNAWTNRSAWQAGAPDNALPANITDNFGNWAIDYHCYFDQWSQGKTAGIEEGWLDQVEAFTAMCKAGGYRAFASEFGFGSDADSLTAGTHFLAHLEANPSVYLGWTYWAGGGWWDNDYVYLADPMNGTDRPQMAVIAKYL